MHLKFDTNIFRTLATARFLQQPADVDIQIDADRVVCNYSGGFCERTSRDTISHRVGIEKL